MYRIVPFLLGFGIVISGCAGHITWNQRASPSTANQDSCVSNGGIWHGNLDVCESASKQ
jgi:hypothetical protein